MNLTEHQDVAFGPDGTTIYVITDSAGPVQGIGDSPVEPIASIKNSCSLLMFEYEGSTTTNQIMNNTTNPI